MLHTSLSANQQSKPKWPEKLPGAAFNLQKPEKLPGVASDLQKNEAGAVISTFLSEAVEIAADARRVKGKNRSRSILR